MTVADAAAAADLHRVAGSWQVVSISWLVSKQFW